MQDPLELRRQFLFVELRGFLHPLHLVGEFFFASIAVENDKIHTPQKGIETNKQTNKNRKKIGKDRGPNQAKNGR